MRANSSTESGIISDVISVLESDSAIISCRNEDPNSRVINSCKIYSLQDLHLSMIFGTRLLLISDITSDIIPDSVEEFARMAHSLGYLGRGEYNLDGIYYGMEASG